MDGSGGGFGRLEEAARAVLAMEEPLQAVVVTGREAALEARLRQARGRTRVSGSRSSATSINVRQLMAAADFLVTKAGGLTLAEALAAELPVICFGSLPGQEARNERFAAMAGVGLVAEIGRAAPARHRRRAARSGAAAEHPRAHPDLPPPAGGAGDRRDSS